MPQPAKKRKTTTGSGVANFKETRQKIRSLEASLSDKSNLNNVVQLLDIVNNNSNNAQVVHAAIHALHRVFSRFLTNGDLDPPSDPSSATGKVTLWLSTQFTNYLKRLRQLLSDDEPGLQVPALKILMTLVKTQSEYNNKVANDQLHPIVYAMVWNKNLSTPLHKEFVEKYANAYDDLRYHFYRHAADTMTKALEKTKSPADLRRLAQNVFSIVQDIHSMPTEQSEVDEFYIETADLKAAIAAKKKRSGGDDDDEDALLLGDSGLVSDEEEEESTEKTSKKKDKKKSPVLQLDHHRRAFQSCWIALLKLPLTEEIYKKTLLFLHKRILPHLREPRFLMDFLTDSYNVGGSVSLLALNGLFVLITEYNLDYPDFYPKLYTLLDRDVMHVKYRSRFFRLLDIFLSSTLLPANMIAAFIKRLARLSLTAPPAASVIIIPFIYNLLRRHPICMKLIHKNDAGGEAEDPYDFNQKNPYETKALESSLWEIQTLSEHYYANVSTLAKIFSEKFLKPKYNLEDFMDHTYSTFFKTEIERKRKREPAMAFEKPESCEWTL
ncbi:CBF/Mak21 family-domain-containing protein [Zychaea mexicana]|uniref:CBF/Mak21 family-domain-containing protein n=1 Tax=Zychaea mexicana TaxID=64656 RepID=UPI0022FE0DFA|nr:CBF/Mak21 family-domain-containing protein [Zychaea mexicana]KAI9498253.1 CBF/Mak21 family-domain-containing protein [Zychaea mexicana]